MCTFNQTKLASFPGQLVVAWNEASNEIHFYRNKVRIPRPNQPHSQASLFVLAFTIIHISGVAVKSAYVCVL